MIYNIRLAQLYNILHTVGDSLDFEDIELLIYVLESICVFYKTIKPG